MPLIISTQVQIIVYAIISGLLIGIMFDIYKLLRGVDITKWIVAIEDILFCILASIVVFIFLLYKSSTFDVYVYSFIGIVTLLYIKFISPYTVKILFKTKENIKRFFRILIKAMVYLFKISIKMGRKR